MMLKFFSKQFAKCKLRRPPTTTELDIKCEAVYAMTGENSQAIVYLLNEVKSLKTEFYLHKKEKDKT